VYEARENGLPDYEGGIVTHEFFCENSPTTPKLTKSSIQTTGYTKCRFPVLAKRYVVRDGEVLHADPQFPEPIDE